HVPGRLGLAVLLQRGAPPQAFWMRGVAPEIVEQAAAPRGAGNAVVGVEHVEHRGAVGLEPRIDQRARGLGIARRDPFAHLRAVDLLEPEIGVGRVGEGHVRYQRVGWAKPRSGVPTRMSCVKKRWARFALPTLRSQ